MIAALRAREPFAREGLAARAAPFLLPLVLGFGLFPTAGPRDWWFFTAAVLLAAGASLLGMVIPWSRLPHLAAVLPPLLLVASIAVLRQAQGGSLSGYGALFLIPVLWVACYGTQAQLAIVLAAVASAFWIPIAIVGEPLYPASQLRSGGLLVLIVGIFGIIIQQLIATLLREERRRAAADRRLRELGAYEIHDDVVQNLTVAQLALALGDPKRAARALERALGDAQTIVDELLHARPRGEPGGLVRRQPDTGD